MNTLPHLHGESSFHRMLVFGGLMLLVLSVVAFCAALAYYSAYFFAPGL